MPNLFDHYDRLPGIPPKLLNKVQQLCGPRYADLLFHLPHSIIDRTSVVTIKQAHAGKLQTIKVKVVETNSPSHAKAPFKVLVQDSTDDTMQLLFFNVGNWIKRNFPTGKEFYISGVIEEDFITKKVLHPEIYDIKENIDDIARLEPIYPLSRGINNKMLTKAINYALSLVPEKAEFLPEKILNEHNFKGFKYSLQRLHNPQRIEDITVNSIYRQRIAFDELYAWQTVLVESLNRNKVENAFVLKIKNNLELKLLNSLDFSLTKDQLKAIEEIKTDLQSNQPMLRLVQGDVGAGKTLVAFCSMLQAVENKFQACMMAPTEILASQHFTNAQQILEPLGLKIGLLKSKMKAKEKRELLIKLKTGEINIIFGTHALIQDNVKFKCVSLAVIDEQHRFGVKQRLKLTSLNSENTNITPDVLVMTATPIPRTLQLTAYGDMDISLIKEKPPGRVQIKTSLIADSKLPQIAQSLQRVLDKKEQVYWVCPLVEESEKSDLMAATRRFDELVSIYPEKVALLHGKMKQKEKDSIMAEFKAGIYKILVSTTVIEVGVDVPKATTMVIEHSERFGLAQLHQLRGRVGRSNLESNCLLVHPARLSAIARERLEIMRKSDDGFLIAEKDLDLRGPGESLGTNQSGYVITKVANLQTDKQLTIQARNLALATFDKSLKNDELKKRIVYLQKLFNRHETAKLLGA